MALPISDKPSPATANDKAIRRQEAEQSVLMREVDEAVRHDEFGDVMRRYGLLIGGAVALALAGFGGFLYWKNQQESDRERFSEQLVQAFDELEAGNLDTADAELAAIAANGGPGAAAAARLAQAGIALNAGRDEDAIALYDAVASDQEAPPAMRDLAAIRSVALQFDTLDPQVVIDRLGPLAQAQNPWFGSAGELVAMAYLEQGREEQAGPLLVEIASNEDVPDSLRARTRQLAGFLGYDAIEDVEEIMAEITEGVGEAAQAPPQQ